MKYAACVVMMMVLWAGSPGFAQETSPTLSEADGAQLAQAISTPLMSFAFEGSAALAVTGLDSFALNASVSGSGAVDLAAHALRLTLDGPLVLGSTRAIPVSAEMRLLNDVLYLNPGDGWQAREGAAALAVDLIHQLAGLDADSAALSRWDLLGVDGLSDILVALAAIDPATYTTTQRLSDESGGGVQMAHFRTTANLHAMMQADGFTQAVAAFASAQGNNLVIYGLDELAEIVRANSILFENTVLTLDYYVSPDDGLLHRMTMTLDMPLEPARLAYPEAPFMVSAQVDLTLSQHNRPQAITAPADAVSAANFTFPVTATLESPGEGATQYIFFETIGEAETYIRRFEAEASDRVTITVRGLGLELDAHATLVADDEVLAESDDHETTAFGLGDLDPQIADFLIPETGVYTVEIAEFEGRPGSFVLTIVIRR